VREKEEEGKERCTVRENKEEEEQQEHRRQEYHEQPQWRRPMGATNLRQNV
jgi:hypothetical protein